MQPLLTKSGTPPEYSKGLSIPPPARLICQPWKSYPYFQKCGIGPATRPTTEETPTLFHPHTHTAGSFNYRNAVSSKTAFALRGQATSEPTAFALQKTARVHSGPLSKPVGCGHAALTEAATPSLTTRVQSVRKKATDLNSTPSSSWLAPAAPVGATEKMAC